MKTETSFGLATQFVNAAELFCKNTAYFPDRQAIVSLSGPPVSFIELYQMAARSQQNLQKQGLRNGDSLLVFAKITPELYAVIIAALASGISLIFVEPWMPVPMIAQVISTMQPKAFVCSKLGRFWGLRVQAIRQIQHYFTADELVKGARKTNCRLECVPLPPEAKGIVTFTSGTTGSPKGVSRPHGYLVEAARIFQNRVLNRAVQGLADLCIFANFTLLNLAAGRTTILFPASPSSDEFNQLESFHSEILPSTVTCGPAFFRDLISLTSAESRIRQSLQDIHVGGAPSDCSLWESGFAAFPNAQFTHIYGSSEVEPVSLADAQAAVRLSRQRGFYQNLCVGRTVPEINSKFLNDELWVSGPHVCPEYISASQSEHLVKQRDSNNAIWHNMGDRVTTFGQDNELWYLGRSTRTLENVLLEQRLFNFIDTSEGFLIDTNNFGKVFVTSSPKAPTRSFQQAFPEVAEIVLVRKIERDKRHRARIDTKKTLLRNAPWLVG